MDSQARKKDTQSAWFDIAVFAVVAAFFLFSAKSLLRSQARSGTNQANAAAPMIDRSLASTQHAGPSPISEDHSVQVFTMDCLFGSTPAAFTTKAGMVRIVANICGGKKPVGKSAAFVGKNDSSGEDIVPFVQDGAVMTTNYFSLREGKNKISFQLALGKGQMLRQELELVREPREE